MEIEKKRNILKKRGAVFFFARTVSNWGFKWLANVKTEFETNLHDLKKENSVFLYTGLHRSLWETTGILSALHKHKLPIPLVGMGDNLIKGKFFVSLAKRTGSLFIVKRGKKRRDLVESAKLLKRYVFSLVAYGKDTLLFPEGTRKNIPATNLYGKFFPTAFDALLEYEKSKAEIVKNTPELKLQNSYIVPFNIDYSRVREAYELTGYNANIPRTLKLWDSLKMLKNIGNVYISFGKPIKISNHLDLTRKEIAAVARERCLGLVKILPINIVSRAIIRSLEKNKTDKHTVIQNISMIMDKIIHLENKFRGFKATDSAEEIYNKVAKINRDFSLLSKSRMPVYMLYSDYINHYFMEDESVTKSG